jgi:nucleotide-binding universal stress UspA family protein
MYKRILLPTDGSELSQRAIMHGIAMAKAIGASVLGVTVTRPWHVVTADPTELSETEEGYVKRTKAIAADRLARVQQAARESGVACDVTACSADHPYEAIIDTALNKHCDLIVMASHGRSGIKALVLGSETQKVLTHSKIPVLVHRYYRESFR